MARKYLQFYNGMWKGILTDEQAEQLINIKTYCEDIPALRNVISDLTYEQIEKIVAIDKYLRKHKTLEGLPPIELGEVERGTLEPYQTIGSAFMFASKGCLLGDEVGLGKTVQSAAVFNMFKQQHINEGKKPHRYLFLADLTAVKEIRDKLVRFTGEYVYLLPNAQKKEIELLLKYDDTFDNVSIVGTHGLMLNQQFLAYAVQKGFTTVVFDEGKEIKNKNTMHNNVKALFSRVENKYVLNATPFEIELRDMYNQIEVIDDQFLPYVGDFEGRYVVRRYEGYVNKVVRYKNEEEFVRMSSLRYLARTRKQLGAEYVENEYEMIRVPLSKEQKEIITKTTLKYQVVDCPTTVFPKIPFNRETTPKLDALIKLLEYEVLQHNKKVIVYCRFREAQAWIKEELAENNILAECINSSVTNRNEITDQLKEGKIDVILTSVFRSLDIGYADTAVLYSIDTNPQIMRQFEGRITRSFDVKGKTIYLIVSEGYEQTFVDTELKMRIEASKSFAVTGESMVFDIIEHKDKDKKAQQLSFLEENEH